MPFYNGINVPGWWNGRHGGLKIRCPKKRVGSSPTLGTNLKNIGGVMKIVVCPKCQGVKNIKNELSIV